MCISRGTSCVAREAELKHECIYSPELELKYMSCYARILDAKRRFLEAATRYYDLSQTGGTNSDAGIKVRHSCLLSKMFLFYRLQIS